MKKISFSFFALLLVVLNIAHAQIITISGKITDIKGIAVPGVSVLIKGLQKGTISDSSGFFSVQTTPGSILILTAVGFEDKEVLTGSQPNIIVVLKQKTALLNEVTVSGNLSNNPLLPFAEITLRDYLLSPSQNNGTKYIEDLPEGYLNNVVANGAFSNLNAGTSGRVSGAMLPEYHQKEEAKGSRYLFSTWVSGIVVKESDSIINKPSFLYNYDKMTGRLLLFLDIQNCLEIDRQHIKAFALKNAQAAFIFEHVPAIDKNSFFVLLAKGAKYAAFKSIKTKLAKASYNYQSTGLTSIGNNYDEYTDNVVYYFVDIINNTAKQFDLKKQSIKTAFEDEKIKTDSYFANFPSAEMNESFITGLIGYLNK